MESTKSSPQKPLAISIPFEGKSVVFKLCMIAMHDPAPQAPNVPVPFLQKYSVLRK